MFCQYLKFKVSCAEIKKHVSSKKSDNSNVSSKKSDNSNVSSKKSDNSKNIANQDSNLTEEQAAKADRFDRVTKFLTDDIGSLDKFLKIIEDCDKKFIVMQQKEIPMFSSPVLPLNSTDEQKKKVLASFKDEQRKKVLAIFKEVVEKMKKSSDHVNYKAFQDNYDEIVEYDNRDNDILSTVNSFVEFFEELTKQKQFNNKKIDNDVYKLLGCILYRFSELDDSQHLTMVKEQEDIKLAKEILNS